MWKEVTPNMRSVMQTLEVRGRKPAYIDELWEVLADVEHRFSYSEDTLSHQGVNPFRVELTPDLFPIQYSLVEEIP